MANPLSASLIAVALLSLLILKAVPLQQPTTLSIDSDAAPDSNSSLQYHLCGPGSGDLGSDTTLLLSGGVHTLQEGPFCLLQNLNNFMIQGQQTQPPRTVIYCRSESETRRGIAFFNISNLHLSHIDIVNCGREVPSGLPGGVNNTFVYLGPLQKAVVIITHSINTTLENISIEKCFGFGFFFLNPLGNTVIKHSSFKGTTYGLGLTECRDSWHGEKSDMSCSGSGLVAVFDDTDITDQLVEYSDNYVTSFSINDCTIVNNSNWMPVGSVNKLRDTLFVGYKTERILMTGGLSLALYTRQRDYFVNVKISDTRILSNVGNIPTIFVVQYNTIQMSTTVLERVTVSDNTQVSGMNMGAGLMFVVTLFLDSLGTYPQSQSEMYDLLEITDSYFTHNNADKGGAIMFYMTPQNVSNVRVLIRNTTFADNIASSGSALYAFRFPSVTSKGTYIYMEDITASGNTFPKRIDSSGAIVLDNPPDDSGVFIASQCLNITLVGTKAKGSHYSKNNVSVFTAVRTNVILYGWITFEDNRGYRGGALSLIDGSILFIHDGSDIEFTRNTAFRRGGAIYTNALGSYVSVTCAIQFLAERKIKIDDLRLLDVSIVFANNSAQIAGNSVFGNSLYYCMYLPTTSIDDPGLGVRQALIYMELFYFSDVVGNNLPELSSVEEIICICPPFTRLNYCTITYMLDYLIFPGGTFTISLNSVDFAYTPVASFLYSFLRSVNLSDHVELDVSQEVRRLPGLTTCSSVEFRVFAPENRSLFIDLYAKIGGEKATIELKTTFCPPGFVLGSSDGTSRLSCLCSEFIETRLGSTCNITEVTIARPTKYWVGTKTVDNGGTIIQFVSTCPINYCREDVTDIDLRLSDQLCMEGRTGTLCGACRQSLSSVFGTAECRKCSNAWLATLVLFALIGALMVVTAFLLDLTITHGLINGLFFYSNIVMVNANIFFQGNQRGFLFWFLSWVNLDIGFPLCFYDGMTESAKAGLQYVFPTYIILMIAAIIIVSQRSLRMQRIISQLDGIHVLVSMFYISFLKLFRTVIDTFTFVTIVTESEEDKIVWFFNGNQKISDPISIFLILLGFLTLAGFILPYMVFFTFSTYIQRCVNSTRLNAYVDASLAPYKNKLRFWFGARLILTSIIYIIIANRGTDNPKLSLTLELSLLVGFSLIQAFMRPFESLLVAILDLSFLFNLIALTLGVLYTIQNRESYRNQEIIVNISLSVALLTNIGIILWHSIKTLRKYKRIKEKVLRVATRLIQALKLGRGIDKLVARIGRKEGNGELQSEGEYHTGYSKLEVAPGALRSSLGLQDMIAAPEANKTQEKASSPQPELREPVLGYAYGRSD